MPQISLYMSRRVWDGGQVFGGYVGPICSWPRFEPGRIYGDGSMSKCFFAVAILIGTFSTAAVAGPVTDEESKYCAYDYRQYCNQDGLGSQLLALCMKDHGKELSPECIKALEDAGEVTPEEKSELKKIGE